MEIFFGGSIRGGRSDGDLYATLIEYLKRHGTVLTEHIGRENVEQEEADAGLTDADIYEQDVAWLRQADAVVSEVTTPSLGVGYEVGKAVAWDKPVLCLYRPTSDHELSAMIRGNDAVRVAEYQRPEEVEEVIADFLTVNR